MLLVLSRQTEAETEAAEVEATTSSTAISWPLPLTVVHDRCCQFHGCCISSSSQKHGTCHRTSRRICNTPEAQLLYLGELHALRLHGSDRLEEATTRMC